jgi:CheY-like chemotaxis protein
MAILELSMMPVVAVMDDLMFLSRLREAARGLALEVRVLRRSEDAAALAAAAPSLVVVDADSDRLPWSEIVRTLRSQPALTGVPVVAFVSHVDAARAALAREAGAQRVLARSTFVRELPALLSAAATPPS